MKSWWPLPFVICSLLAAGGIIAIAHSLVPAPSVLAAGSPVQEGAQDNASPPSLAGNWQMSWVGANGERQGSMQLKQDGSKLSGKLQGERGAATVTGSIQGNQVSLNVKLRRRQIAFSGTVEGDRMSGTTEQGSNWSATRRP
jgi:hypothetical protein